MIKVVATNYVKADKIDAFIATFKELSDATRLEPGCVYYDLCQDVKDPTILTVQEEWKTMEDLNLHMKTPHFTKVVPLLGEFQEKEGGVSISNKVL